MATWRVALVLAFLSGASSLLYEVTWLREFRSLFGGSTLASATVLGLFMAGLGLGAVVLGPRIEAHRAPFRLYLMFELFILVFAGVSPWLVQGVGALYLKTGGSQVLGEGGATLIRLLLALPILLPPTFLMGGTFPALARACEETEGRARWRSGLLYGVNTLGGVVGSVLATYVLIEAFGQKRTIWLGVCLNAFVVLGGRELLVRGAVEKWPSSRLVAPERQGKTKGGSVEGPIVPGSNLKQRSVLYGLAFVSGFGFFLFEILAYRLLGPLLGGSVFSLGAILSVALLGLGIGGVLYGIWSVRRGACWEHLGLCFLAQAFFLWAPLAWGDGLAVWAARLDPGPTGSFGARVGVWVLLSSVFIFPSALLSGFLFPLFLALLGRGARGVAADSGRLYGANTLGAVVGSILGGFVLLSAFGAVNLLRALILLPLLSMIVALGFGRQSDRFLKVVYGLVAIGLGTGAWIVQGPTAAFRHSGVGVGRFPSGMENSNISRDFVHWHRRALVWEEEGRESSVALMAYQGLAFVVNGKVDGHATLDAPTQVMAGLLGSLLHGHPKRSLVIGLGTGSTAGWLGRVSEIDEVRVYELEPSMRRVAAATAIVNQHVLDNPKVEIVTGDARELLMTEHGKYDLIVSEPSNPYRAGIASLFTTEYYEAIQSRLNEGGVFVQWVQVYEVDAQAIDLVYRTLGGVFPAIETWRTHRDLLLVASAKPLDKNGPRLRARIAEEPYRKALALAWQDGELEGLFGHYVASPAFAHSLLAGRIEPTNTDDRNLLEFRFARSVNRHDLYSMDAALARAVRLGVDRPERDLGLDWGLVEVRRRLLYEGGEQVDPSRVESREASRLLAVGLEEARGAAQFGREISPALRTLLAENEPSALDVVDASTAYRARDTRRAVAHLTRVFERLQSDPWLDFRTGSLALQLATQIGRADRRRAEEWIAILSVPFAAEVLHDQRLDSVLFLAAHHPITAACASAVAPYEPWVPFSPGFLQQRVRCYEALLDPRLERARADLSEAEAE